MDSLRVWQSRVRLHISVRENKLVEALRFYADPETWFHECQGQSLNVIDANDQDELLEHKMSFDNELDCYQDVGGKKAREVLKELGVKGE